GGFDLATVAFDPLLITARWSGWSSLTLLARYDLTTAVVEEISLSGRWNSETNEISWEVPYEPRVGRFKPIVFEIRGKGKTGKLTLTGKVDLGEAKLIEGILHVELRSEVGWGINLSGRYEQGSQTILAPSLGLFRDLCDCLRIGIEYESGQVWLYTSILAFPKAVLRYAPTGAGLKVGQ
ncbi:hypothetical protein KAX17_02300, partial [Candidatus Bipolaricaulota bacterium]|nr:hypothetical protein [Candidatus Bipolaricaulota bacterium]